MFQLIHGNVTFGLGSRPFDPVSNSLIDFTTYLYVVPNQWFTRDLEPQSSLTQLVRVRPSEY